MSMFYCAKCNGLRDSDDGCAEWGHKLRYLICADCMGEEDDDERDGCEPVSGRTATSFKDPAPIAEFAR